jgi:hypothetical protein
MSKCNTSHNIDNNFFSPRDEVTKNWITEDRLNHRFDRISQPDEVDGPLCWALTALLVKRIRSSDPIVPWRLIEQVHNEIAQ